MRILAAIVALCAAMLLIIDWRHAEAGDPRRLSRRAAWIAFIVAILATSAAAARPAPYPGVTPFEGDKYSARQAQMGADVVKAVRIKRAGKARYLYPTRKRPPVSRQRWRLTPMPAPRPLASEAYRAEPLSVGEGIQREAARVVGGRPAGCPHRYCGCGASLHIFGRIIPALNLAANWLRFPRAIPGPNMVAARRGHVFVLKQHIAGNTWLVFDANSGRGRTRIHPRSIVGYQIVNPHRSSS